MSSAAWGLQASSRGEHIGLAGRRRDLAERPSLAAPAEAPRAHLTGLSSSAVGRRIRDAGVPPDLGDVVAVALVARGEASADGPIRVGRSHADPVKALLERRCVEVGACGLNAVGNLEEL